MSRSSCCNTKLTSTSLDHHPLQFRNPNRITPTSSSSPPSPPPLPPMTYRDSCWLSRGSGSLWTIIDMQFQRTCSSFDSRWLHCLTSHFCCLYSWLHLHWLLHTCFCLSVFWSLPLCNLNVWLYHWCLLLRSPVFWTLLCLPSTLPLHVFIWSFSNPVYWLPTSLLRPSTRGPVRPPPFPFPF